MAGGDRAYIVEPADLEGGARGSFSAICPFAPCGSGISTAETSGRGDNESLLAKPHSLVERYVARGHTRGGVAGAHCSQRDLSGLGRDAVSRPVHQSNWASAGN